MKKRNVVSFLLILCIVASFLTACGDIDGPATLGHRFGNPEITFTDGKAIIKHVCVDCDYYEIEERTGSTQVADASAWDEAFQNLSLTKYSVEFRTYLRDKVELQRFIVTEDRGYYTSSVVNAQDVNQYGDEYYTLQKEDGTYITYIRSGEGGKVSLAPETDGSYFEEMRKESGIYLPLEGKFDKFTYDAESGSYISTEPMEVELRDANGISLGVKTLQYVCVNVADGQILGIKADYSTVNEYLETINQGFSFYNIGYSVVKVPQSVIEEAVRATEPVDPLEHFTYEVKNGEVTVTKVDTAISGNVTIPSELGGLPVVAIGENAFADCAKLTGITIPASVATIGDNAFVGCSGLKNVNYAGTQAQWEAITISQTGNSALLNITVQFSATCEHSYDEGVVTKEPNCGEEGIKTYTCASCGDTKVEYLGKQGAHSYDDGTVTENATCCEAGMKTYTCTVCGKNKTEFIPKTTTHNYTNGTCIDCGADDPQYAADTDEGEEAGGLLGAIIKLLQSIIDVLFFFL